jgi:1-deoxy-D-xylulose-5-phosphate synthase
MSDAKRAGLLDSIDTPADLRALGREQLGPLSVELRDYLIHTVGPMGGPLSNIWQKRA